MAGQQKIYQLLQFKADVSLVKTHIAALEDHQKRADRDRRQASLQSAQDELGELKLEEQRLRAALEALEKRRAAVSAANESSRKGSE